MDVDSDWTCTVTPPASPVNPNLTSCDPAEPRCGHCGDVLKTGDCDHATPDLDCTPTEREFLADLAADGHVPTCLAVAL